MVNFRDVSKGYTFSSTYTGSAGPVTGLDMSLSNTVWIQKTTLYFNEFATCNFIEYRYFSFNDVYTRVIVRNQPVDNNYKIQYIQGEIRIRLFLPSLWAGVFKAGQIPKFKTGRRCLQVKKGENNTERK